MHAEKSISHHVASWMARISAAAIMSSGLVWGLQLAQGHHNNNHSVSAEAGNMPAATVTEDQTREGADVAGGIALVALVPFAGSISWRLVQRQQAETEPVENPGIPYMATDISPDLA